MTCLGMTDGMHSTSTSVLDVMLMLPPSIEIKQEAGQAANRLQGIGCYYMPDMHSEGSCLQ
jgi:hypothetical protein